MSQASVLQLCAIAFYGVVSFGANAQGELPAREIEADTYTRALPESGARIAIFEAGPGFREEMFRRDPAQIFDRLLPGQPPLLAADVIVARVDSWQEAAEVYDGTPLQDLVPAMHGLPSHDASHVAPVEMFGGHEVLTFTFLNVDDGEVVDARCMARLVVDTLYTGTQSDLDLAACSRALN